MRKIQITLFMMLPCLLASGDGSNCKEVSWGIATNFLTESGTVNFPGKVGNNSLTRLLEPRPAISQEHSVSMSSVSNRKATVSSLLCATGTLSITSKTANKRGVGQSVSFCGKRRTLFKGRKGLSVTADPCNLTKQL
jgi:hypothetical protein